MAYVSLYRKYRSQTFGDLVGQEHVIRTLQNGIERGRIAHSYLFTGPRGTGKTSTARLLAKALCCEHGPSANFDNNCEICNSITAGTCVDVMEMDAASESGVEDIRSQIVESVEYKPMVARYKVFIIDEVHDLSAKAFDALLKTIEEPPEHIVFILATTEYNKVPPTIRSRCQKHEFHRASMKDLIGRLNYVAEQEGVTAEPQAIAAIARMADGGYRDALTLLEQAMLTSDGTITMGQVYDQLGLVSEEVVDSLLVAMKGNDVPQIMELLAEVARLGRDPRALLESMLYRLADLTRATYQLETAAGDSTREAALHDAASRIGKEQILRFRGELATAHKVIRDITLPRLWLESELVRISMPKLVAATVTPAPPVSAARSKPEPIMPVAPVEAPAPTSTESSEPGSAAKIPATTSGDRWQTTLRILEPQSKILIMKLSDVSVAADDGSRLVLEFEREFEYDWVTSRPKAVGMIREAVRSGFGPEYATDFQIKRREISADQPVAVELPAEGSRLEQLAREVFGLNQDPQEDPNPAS